MTPRRTRKLRLERTHPAVGVIGWIVALLMFFPIFWMLLASLKTEVQAVQTPPLLVFTPTLQNYVDIFQRADYIAFAINSVVISFGSTILALLIAVPAAFAMAFYPTVALAARCYGCCPPRCCRRSACWCRSICWRATLACWTPGRY